MNKTTLFVVGGVALVLGMAYARKRGLVAAASSPPGEADNSTPAGDPPRPSNPPSSAINPNIALAFVTV